MLVSIGDNCIDRYVAPIAVQHVGGNALNVAANLALHRLPAAYAGVVGSDANGDLIVAALTAIGVNTACVERSAGATGITQIELTHGDYRILQEDYGVSDAVCWTPALHELVRAQADRIHLTVSGCAQRLIEDFELSDVPVSVDLGNLAAPAAPAALQRYRDLLKRTESVFMSVGAQLSDDDVRRLLLAAAQQGPRHAIATRGATGAATLWQGQLICVPPLLPAAAVVDTVGAGDAFIAGFLASTEQSPLEERLLCGSRWSAEVCSHIGAWEGSLAAGSRAESAPMSQRGLRR